MKDQEWNGVEWKT